jgi:signal transduction histidine kinase
MALHIALALTLAETVALAAVLMVWAHRVPGARLLTVFLLGVAVWITGNELPNWFGPQCAAIALALLATVALTSAAFLHFCLIFCRVSGRSTALMPVVYAIAAAATLLSWIVRPGEFKDFPAFKGIEWVVVPNWAGWTTSMVWAVFAAAGVCVLLYRLLRASDVRERSQVAAVAVSCGWGLMCMSGYAFAALDIPQYPWQVLALPGYPLILVYGILRYQVFVANAWARRALAWALLLALGLAAVPLSLLLPVDSRWASGALVAIVCLALNGPVRRVAERIVYPGGRVSVDDLAQWRHALSQAHDWDALAKAGSELLSQRVGLAVAVRLTQEGPSASDTPLLVCAHDEAGWRTRLVGWEAAPPGPRHAAELFADVLAQAAERLEQAMQAELRERERQLQARLAELGSLAATVAHDLRNPLNIISMAAATASQDTRREIAHQVARISRLAEDLLDYAKPWQLRPVRFDAAAQVRGAVARAQGVELGQGLDGELPLEADPQRFEQALANLLSNARSAAGARRVRVDAERDRDALHVHVCDDGSGIPEDIRERLFQPFVSRSPGGTGLGLAIVARIMAAHGGSVRLNERPPWSTCFTLTFPLAR